MSKDTSAIAAASISFYIYHYDPNHTDRQIWQFVFSVCSLKLGFWNIYYALAHLHLHRAPAFVAIYNINKQQLHMSEELITKLHSRFTNYFTRISTLMLSNICIRCLRQKDEHFVAASCRVEVCGSRFMQIWWSFSSYSTIIEEDLHKNDAHALVMQKTALN